MEKYSLSLVAEYKKNFNLKSFLDKFKALGFVTLQLVFAIRTVINQLQLRLQKLSGLTNGYDVFVCKIAECLSRYSIQFNFLQKIILLVILP